MLLNPFIAQLANLDPMTGQPLPRPPGPAMPPPNGSSPPPSGIPSGPSGGVAGPGSLRLPLIAQATAGSNENRSMNALVDRMSSDGMPSGEEMFPWDSKMGAAAALPFLGVAAAAGGPIPAIVGMLYGAGSAIGAYLSRKDQQKQWDAAVATKKAEGAEVARVEEIELDGVQFKAQLNKQGDIVGLLPITQDDPRTEKERIFAWLEGLRVSNPEAYNRAQEMLAKSGININLPGENIAPTKSTTNTLQKDALRSLDIGEQFGVIESKLYSGTGPDREINKDLLTKWGQWKNWGYGAWEKVGGELTDEQKQSLSEYEQFSMFVEQAFNTYRVAVTGAAAAMQELERLQKAYINMDLSPTQFAARLEALQKDTERAKRLRFRLMTQGFDPYGSEEGQAQFGRMFDAGVDPRLDPENAYEQLRAMGYSDEEAYEEMADMGIE